jgi:hypothetical protein
MKDREFEKLELMKYDLRPVWSVKISFFLIPFPKILVQNKKSDAEYSTSLF